MGDRHLKFHETRDNLLGLNRWPSRQWPINVAWTQVVALAANLLACFRHLALPEGELRDAAPKLLRYRLLHLPARLTRGLANDGSTYARTGPGSTTWSTPGGRSRH